MSYEDLNLKKMEKHITSKQRKNIKKGKIERYTRQEAYYEQKPYVPITKHPFNKRKKIPIRNKKLPPIRGKLWGAE